MPFLQRSFVKSSLAALEEKLGKERLPSCLKLSATNLQMWKSLTESASFFLREPEDMSTIGANKDIRGRVCPIDLKKSAGFITQKYFTSPEVPVLADWTSKQ